MQKMSARLGKYIIFHFSLWQIVSAQNSDDEKIIRFDFRFYSTLSPPFLWILWFRIPMHRMKALSDQFSVGTFNRALFAKFLRQKFSRLSTGNETLAEVTNYSSSATNYGVGPIGCTPPPEKSNSNEMKHTDAKEVRNETTINNNATHREQLHNYANVINNLR